MSSQNASGIRSEQDLDCVVSMGTLMHVAMTMRKQNKFTQREHTHTHTHEISRFVNSNVWLQNSFSVNTL